MKIIFFALLLTFNFLSIQASEFGIVKKYMPKNPVILDCGANNGISSILLVRTFPKALVLAVEADPIVFTTLVAKVKKFKSILPFNFILGDTDGEAEFYPNDRSQQCTCQGSVYKQSQENWYWNIRLQDHPITLPSKKLDTFCSENNLSKIDFLYLDMQGGEYPMLKESKNILPKVSVIYAEVLFEQIYENCPLYNNLKNLLEKNGFVEIQLKRRHKSWGDAIFVKKELL